MSANWDDELLTVNEIAEHLKLNPQTVRNWIDRGSLPALRVGRRVHVRRADLDGILADGKTKGPAAAVAPAVPADARAELEQALSRAQRLLGRRSATRRAELAVGLQDLADAVTAFLGVLADDARDAETTEATENG